MLKSTRTRLFSVPSFLASIVFAFSISNLALWKSGLLNIDAGAFPVWSLLPWTALAITCTSLSALIIAVFPFTRWRYHRIAQFFSAIALFIGFIGCCEYLFGVHLDVGTWLFPNTFSRFNELSFVGRMSPYSALNIVVLNVGALLCNIRSHSKAKGGQGFLFASIAFAVLSLVGSQYGVLPFYGISRFTGMAVPSACSFIILGMSLLFSRDDMGVMALLNEAARSHTWMKRLLWVAMLFPLGIAVMVAIGERKGWFGQEFGQALYVVLSIYGFTGMTALTAKRVAWAERDRLIRAKEQAAREQAEAALRSRDQFLSVASHELKTPLTSIKLNLQLTRRDISRPDGVIDREKVRRFLDQSERGIDRLTRLVEDMLDLSLIAANQLVLVHEEFDLAASVKKVASSMMPIFQREHSGEVAVSAEGPIIGSWDRLRIEKVLINLFTNAARYGEGRPVHISVFASGENAVVKIRDEGKGIAEQDQQRIFKRFERAISANEVSGFGLGLYIAEAVTSAHGGTITVESTLGSGAEFTITLPLRPPARLSTNPPRPEDSPDLHPPH